MKSILNTEAFSEIKNRLDTLSENSERQWGKMTNGQMLRHCQGPLNIMLGKNDYNLKPNWLINLLFKKILYSDKLWRKGLPTAKAFKQTKAYDFTTEKAYLVTLVNELGEQMDKTDWGKHPAFGHLTNEQWGKMQYKHLDHHLRQFGV